MPSFRDGYVPEICLPERSVFDYQPQPLVHNFDSPERIRRENTETLRVDYPPPCPVIPVFDGDPLNYNAFATSFQAHIQTWGNRNVISNRLQLITFFSVIVIDY